MKSLPFSYDKLKNIVSEFPTPFYIYDEKAIRENIRDLKKAYDETIVNAGLDDSTNSFMSPAKYNNYHHISVMGNENEECDHVYDLTGAYTYSHSYNFNGKLRPAELLLCTDGSVKMIRRAGTPDDYFATLKF